MVSSSIFLQPVSTLIFALTYFETISKIIGLLPREKCLAYTAQISYWVIGFCLVGFFVGISIWSTEPAQKVVVWNLGQLLVTVLGLLAILLLIFSLFKINRFC